ncbi:MAG: hypothetical protein U0X74_13645 [Anaerolineales bacterium]
MNDLENIILEEISTLDDMRLIDVIGFIRYLKAEKPIQQEWIAGWYETAIKSIHEQEEELGLKPADLEKQLRKEQSQ